MNKDIQALITTENWEGLYAFLTSNDLPLDEFNAVYEYQYDEMQYIKKGTIIPHRYFVRTDSLITIIVQRRKLEILDYLLARGCELNPKKGYHPLEVLFAELFFLDEIAYEYSDIFEIRLPIIKMLLTPRG